MLFLVDALRLSPPPDSGSIDSARRSGGVMRAPDSYRSSDHDTVLVGLE